MAAFDPEDTSVKFNGRVWIPDFAAWTAITANLDPRIRATVGVRGDVFGRPERGRGRSRAASCRSSSRSRGRRGYPAGAYPAPAGVPVARSSRRSSKSERSTQTIAGLQYEPREGVRVQASAYYTDRTHLITRDLDGALGNNGRGTTVGAELLATYRGGPWFGWLSYSYSTRRASTTRAPSERLFTFDQPHSLNAAVSWKRGKLAARRSVPALLRPAVHAGDRLGVRQRSQHLHPALRRAELGARADAPPARPARRPLVEVGADRDDRRSSTSRTST